MAESTPSGSASGTEPALIYDAGERRTHAEHATEAHDFAQRADSMQRFADDSPNPGAEQRYLRLAESNERRAQWHATMAVYEALRQGIVMRTTA